MFFPLQGHTLICTLEAGAAFGESILYDTPRNATVITSSSVMLLRVEQKDFKILWEVPFSFSGTLCKESKGKNAFNLA